MHPDMLCTTKIHVANYDFLEQWANEKYMQNPKFSMISFTWFYLIYQELSGSVLGRPNWMKNKLN